MFWPMSNLYHKSKIHKNDISSQEQPYREHSDSPRVLTKLNTPPLTDRREVIMTTLVFTSAPMPQSSVAARLD